VSAKPVMPREVALRDIEEAIDYCLRHADKSYAGWFIRSLELTFRHISESPETGFAEHTRDLDLPGLKIWPPLPYPYVVFFVERETHIDVWRVLYAERKILDVITA